MNVQKLLKGLSRYIIVFLMVAFLISCCMMLFVRVLAASMDLTFNEQNIAAAAKLTFGNVALITLLFTVIDYFRRRLMVELPVRRITQATEKLMQGDFSVRIQPLRGAGME